MVSVDELRKVWVGIGENSVVERLAGLSLVGASVAELGGGAVGVKAELIGMIVSVTVHETPTFGR